MHAHIRTLAQRCGAAARAGTAFVLASFEPRHGRDSAFSVGERVGAVHAGLPLDGPKRGKPGKALLCPAPSAVRAALPFGAVAGRIGEGWWDD